MKVCHCPDFEFLCEDLNMGVYTGLQKPVWGFGYQRAPTLSGSYNQYTQQYNFTLLKDSIFGIQVLQYILL